MTALLTFLYSGLGAILVIFYIPQIITVCRDRTGAAAICLVTWGFWSLSALVTIFYAMEVVKDLPFALVTTGNFLGCFLVFAISAFKRWQRFHSLAVPLAPIVNSSAR